jgi:hypothetical protein
MDTDTSALHVQVSMAQRYSGYLLVGLSIDLRKQASDHNTLPKQLYVSDTSAFQNSLLFLLKPDNVSRHFSLVVPSWVNIKELSVPSWSG